MEYMLITLATIALLTLIVYFLANQVLRIAIGMKPLLVCAACAVVISVVLPRMVVGVMGLAGTLGVILFCAAIFAYLIAYHYDKQPASLNEAIAEETAPILVAETFSQQRDAVQPEKEQWGGRPEEDAVSEEPEEKTPLHLNLALKEEPPISTGLFVYEKSPVEELTLQEEPLAIEAALPDETAEPKAVIAVGETEVLQELQEASVEQDGETVEEEIIDAVEEETLLENALQTTAEVQLTDAFMTEEAETLNETETIFEVETPVAAVVSDELVPVEAEEALPEDIVQDVEEDVLSEAETLVEEEAFVADMQYATMPQDELIESATLSETAFSIESEAETVIEETAASVENMIDQAQEESAVETNESEAEPCQETVVETVTEDLVEDVQEDGEHAVQLNDDRWDVLDVEELWENALQEKEEKSFPLALGCFRAILRRFPESELVPLAAIEAANILRNDGLYDEAIRLFTEARALPAVAEDSDMEQEFVTAIAYLRIVKNILVQNRLGFVPFKNIPEDVSKEIELEFREWRKLA